jgi:hypothetical protein
MPSKTVKPKSTKSAKSAPAAKATASTKSWSKLKSSLNALPDSIDIRDLVYQPSLLSVPPVLVNCGRVPEILDQGQEGACTGFALAAVANFLLHQRGLNRRVSPRMLYELARRYDEWPGEWYEGSSARGAMKGWLRHGACQRALWTDSDAGHPAHDAGGGQGCNEVSRRRLLPGQPSPGARHACGADRGRHSLRDVDGA